MQNKILRKIKTPILVQTGFWNSLSDFLYLLLYRSGVLVGGALPPLLYFYDTIGPLVSGKE